MKSSVDLTKREWKTVWYWCTCYECPSDPICLDSKRCSPCKVMDSIMRKAGEVAQ